MSRLRGAWALTFAVLMVAAAGIVRAPAAGAGPAVRYYLALGDSLAQGVQPNAAGKSVVTDDGYADVLWRHYHAAMPDLRLAKLGCPGETTATMRNGGI